MKHRYNFLAQCAYWVLALCYLLATPLLAQTPPNPPSTQEESEDEEWRRIYEALDIDSVLVTGKPFGIEDFIRMMKDDETFYVAFANLRHISYTASNHIECFNGKNKVVASYQSETAQKVDATDCRTMEVLQENSKGNFYRRLRRNKKYRYYTAKMYDKLFFTTGRVCAQEKTGKSQGFGPIAKHINSLKRLIFQPGKRIQIPGIAGRTAIFSRRMSKFYDYRIQERQFKDLNCHVFVIETKPKYKNSDRTVIRHLETYFEKLTHQVVARNYHLKFTGAFYSFDVKMHIEVEKIGSMYVPTTISYDGRWKVATQKAEKCRFTMNLRDFQVPTMTSQHP